MVFVAFFVRRLIERRGSLKGGGWLEVDCPTTISGTDEKKLASAFDWAGGLRESGGGRSEGRDES